MSQKPFVKTLLAILLIGVLAACQSSEDRAEEHYQNALRLIEEGDLDRASVEFRNVFENNGQHREARSAYAELLRDIDDIQGSYGQYLRLVEQYPDDLEGRVALTQMAIDLQQWDEARRHGREAIEIAPDQLDVRIIAANLDYAQAVEDEDEPARRAAFDSATGLLDEAPDNLSLRRILVDGALRDGDQEEALAQVEIALQIAPDLRQLYNSKLSLLAMMERDSEIEELLHEMVERFPGDDDLTATLLRFFISRGDVEAARTFLTDTVETTEDDTQRREARGALVQLALQTGGADAALEEIDAILADGGEPLVFGALRAGIVFETGQEEEAIAALEALLDGVEPSEEIGLAQVALAQMLMQTGNVVGARALVEEVLAADASQPDALKMKAAWLIEDDETAEAIALLRTALEADPNDVQALTLSARAHSRNGDRSLALDFLALAVEASNSAPEPTVQYARELIADERYRAAEEILIAALRVAPGEPSLLVSLGELYILTEDWSRAEGVEDAMRNIGTEEAISVAERMLVARLASRGQMEDAIALLEELASEGEGDDLVANVAVVRARLANGQGEEALAFAQSALAEDPDNLVLQYTLAATYSAVGQYEEAETSYRAILEARPELEQAWVNLVRILYAQGEIDRAEAALAEGLEVLPEGLELLWAQAGFLERRNDFEGAIAIYEQMYERAPNAPVIANNLASLISTYRDDEESLDRAYTVARRLRGSDFAPFQDTYGWIAYRRGDYEEALEHLEPAAEALADNPLAQYHLGMTYIAVGRTDDALVSLTRAIELADPEDPREQFRIAAEEIARIEAEAAESSE